MSELEEEGMIFQPHTSAGRIPTHLGYRTFVDTVKKDIVLRRKEAQRLKLEYSKRIRTIQEIIQCTSLLLSRELHGAGIVMWPNIEDFYLKHMELIKINAETVMAVLITMTNAVKNYIVRLDTNLARGDLEIISNYINEKYEAEALSHIYAELNRVLDGITSYHRIPGLGLAKAALDVLDTIIKENIDNEIYLSGLNYFMDEPEFKDPEVSRRLFGIFSDRRDFLTLFRQEMPGNGMRVYIGKENRNRMLRDCTMITSGYSLRGRTLGRFGVIGPTRMDYEKAMGIMDFMSEFISCKLEEING
jgi:heat-inducible transcriptional repressor